MHNQPGITHTSYSYSYCQNPPAVLLPKRIAKYFSAKFTNNAFHQLKGIGKNILAALTVGTLLLGGIYFFLVQLANHGW